MRRVAVSILLLLSFLLAWNSALAQTPPPTSPLPTPTPTPEPLSLPDPMGEWWEPVVQLYTRYGFWPTIGLILLLSFFAFFWKVGGEVAGEEAKGIAARLRQGARVAWHRAMRRPTPEERAVIRNVCAACEQLDLRGIVKEGITYVSLESVYVPLTARGGKEPGDPTAGMSLLRAAEGAGEVPLTDLIAPHRCLVLVGQAGSGKTTFLQYVALAAADAYAGRRPGKARWLPDPVPLPILLPLHDLGRHLTKEEPVETVAPRRHLLRDHLLSSLSDLNVSEDWIDRRLEEGNLLLLLDGLDEVARFEDRRFIAELVTRFASFYDRCRIIVTTRPRGYEGAAQLGGDFTRREISDLRWPDDIRTFIFQWNETIARRVEMNARAREKTSMALPSRRRAARPEKEIPLSPQARRRAREQAERLLARLENAPNVRALANNPLLLTVMTIVHYNVGDLPERRAELYDAATALLLGWDKRMGRRAHDPPPWLDDLSPALRRLPLEELALDFQEQGVRERPRDETISFLAQGKGFLAGQGEEAEQAARRRAEEYLAWVADRAYVLQNIGGVIRFYRKPFQEYLAARELARKPDFEERVRRILAEDWRDRWWDETLLLTVGQLITDAPQKANDLLTSIRQLESPPQAPHYNAAFVARALADVPDGLLGHVWQVKESVVEHLAEAVSAVEPAFAPPARLEAGVALGALGDPRPGSGVVAGTTDPSIPHLVWMQVPAGPFLMGSTGEEVERWQEWMRQRVEEGGYTTEGKTQEEVLEILLAWVEGERGRHSVETPAFLISRYPITNAQYECFMDADGYDDPAWWGGEESHAWAWRAGEPRLDWQRTGRPDFWHDPRFNTPNQPVVGVTWYEALAFCRWLTGQLKVSSCKLQVWRNERLETLNLEPETLSARLPTEAEWEKAARGADGRTWPWGNEWDETLANTREGGLEQPSPVGILPAGDSPYGLADTVGNVWEWTSSLWGPDWRRPAFGYPYRPDDGREDTSPGDEVARVIRGGSWGWDQGIARCAARRWDPPHDSDGSRGFRCVSPVSLLF